MGNELFLRRLTAAMEAKGIGQAELYRRCTQSSTNEQATVTRQDISKYVTGKVVPRAKKAEVLASALGVSPEWLLGTDAAGSGDSIDVDAALQQICAAAEADIGAGGTGSKVYRRVIGCNTYIICVSCAGTQDIYDVAHVTELAAEIAMQGDTEDTDMLLSVMGAILDGGTDKDILRRIF